MPHLFEVSKVVKFIKREKQSSVCQGLVERRCLMDMEFQFFKIKKSCRFIVQ